MIWARDHGATLDEELSDVLVPSEMLAVAVREDHECAARPRLATATS